MSQETRHSPQGLIRWLAARLVASPLMAHGRGLFERNSREWTLGLTKLEKLSCGVYLILHDFSVGRLPPKFEDQAAAYQTEIDYYESLPGLSRAEGM